MTDKFCPCSFGPIQLSSNVLTMFYTFLQVILFSYILYKLDISKTDPHKKSKTYFQMFLIGSVVIGIALFIYSLIETIRGTNENILLRKAYCEGKQLKKSESEDCSSIETQKDIFNYLNIFNTAVTFIFSLFVTILFLVNINVLKKVEEAVIGSSSDDNLLAEINELLSESSFGKSVSKFGKKIEVKQSFFLPLFSFILTFLSSISFSTTLIALKE